MRFPAPTELGQGHLARGIEQHLGELAAARAVPPTRRAVLAHAFAGAMMSLLEWWIHRNDAVSAAQMDDHFHQMVWSGIGAPAAQKPSILARSASR